MPHPGFRVHSAPGSELFEHPFGDESLKNGIRCIANFESMPWRTFARGFFGGTSLCDEMPEERDSPHIEHRTNFNPLPLRTFARGQMARVASHPQRESQTVELTPNIFAYFP